MASSSKTQSPIAAARGVALNVSSDGTSVTSATVAQTLGLRYPEAAPVGRPVADPKGKSEMDTGIRAPKPALVMTKTLPPPPDAARSAAAIGATVKHAAQPPQTEQLAMVPKQPEVPGWVRFISFTLGSLIGGYLAFSVWRWWFAPSAITDVSTAAAPLPSKVLVNATTGQVIRELAK